MTSPPQALGHARPNVGTWAAALAFTWWGFFPLYFRIEPDVSPPEVLANRIVWSLLLVGGVLTWQSRWSWLRAALGSRKVMLSFIATALLLSANWMTYIWAVSNGHVVDASLGYFITPLVNVGLGYWLLGERPRRAQWTAFAIAAAGVLWLTASAGRLPWIGLVLGITFGAYGLLRKVASLGALEGLTLETIILAPFAVVAMALWWGTSATSFPGARRRDQRLAARPRTGDDGAAAALRRRRAPLVDDVARAAPVPEPDDPVPARRLALPRAVRRRAPGRLRADLDRARALHLRRLVAPCAAGRRSGDLTP